MNDAKEQFFKTTRQYFQGVYEDSKKQNDLKADREVNLNCSKIDTESDTNINQST